MKVSSAYNFFLYKKAELCVLARDVKKLLTVYMVIVEKG